MNATPSATNLAQPGHALAPENPSLLNEIADLILIYACSTPPVLTDTPTKDAATTLSRERAYTYLNVVPPPSHALNKTVLRHCGTPRAHLLATHGDLHGLNLLIRYGHVRAITDATFWAAVASNRVDVLDWWVSDFKARDNRLQNEFEWRAGSCSPVTQAGENKSFAAIEWLLSHADFVGHCCRDAGAKIGVYGGGLQMPGILGKGRERGADVLVQWIEAGYAIDMNEVWRIIVVASQMGFTQVLEAMEKRDAEAMKLSIIGHEGTLLLNIVQSGAVDTLTWWMRDSRFPTLAEHIQQHTLVEWACLFGRVDVLEWWWERYGETTVRTVPKQFPQPPVDKSAGDTLVPPRRHPPKTPPAPKVSPPMLEPIVISAPMRIRDNTSMAGSASALQWLHRLDFFQDGYTSNAMDWASAQGRTAVLDWWLELSKSNARIQLKYTSNAMDLAPTTSVLQWWVSSGLKLEYTSLAMDGASDTTLLEWWKQSGLQLRYTAKSMDDAYSLKILQWWKESQLELKYSSNAMDTARSCAKLDWWCDSGLELRAKNALYNAIKCNKPKQLDWWLSESRQAHPQLTRDGPLMATMVDQVWLHGVHQNEAEVLDKAVKLGLPLSDNPRFIDECAKKNALKWALGSELNFAYSEKALANASLWGRVDLLKWWDDSGLELIYDHTAMDGASAAGKNAVLEWWFMSGLELKYTSAAVDSAIAKKHDLTLYWWFASGLELKYTKPAKPTKTPAAKQGKEDAAGTVSMDSKNQLRTSEGHPHLKRSRSAVGSVSDEESVVSVAGE